MSRAKAMGTAVETAAVRWLTENGFPLAERLALHGSADQGDIRLQRAPTIIAECKRAMLGVQVTPWMRELDTEVRNAGASYGLLIAQQKGVGIGRVHRWVGAMRYLPWQKLASYCPPDAKELVDVSPTKLNTRYVPTLLNRATSYRLTGPRVPFASTYTPGTTDLEHLTIIGPLEQFIAMFRFAGHGKDTSSEFE